MLAKLIVRALMEEFPSLNKNVFDRSVAICVVQAVLDEYEDSKERDYEEDEYEDPDVPAEEDE